MCERKVRELTVMIALVLLAGCSGHQFSRVNFLHVAYRQMYAIEDHEFNKLQFYVAKGVLAHEETRAQGDAGVGGRVIVMREGTPGIVKEVGDDWLRVSFEEGGPGVFFLADPRKEEDLYWLATTVEGREGLYAVKDLPQKIVLQEGRRYLVMEGADASLLVDGLDMESLIESRRHAKGRELEP
jgi:hypothetical protein